MSASQTVGQEIIHVHMNELWSLQQHAHQIPPSCACIIPDPAFSSCLLIFDFVCSFPVGVQFVEDGIHGSFSFEHQDVGLWVALSLPRTLQGRQMEVLRGGLGEEKEAIRSLVIKMSLRMRKMPMVTAIVLPRAIIMQANALCCRKVW